MDLKSKGITWVGNVYEKFEAMCLEVEDIMCQETAKYVETQVQNVGASVKKFYSEVVQDLLPPSSVDAIKDEVKSSSFEQNDEVDIQKSSKEGQEENPVKRKLPPLEMPEVIAHAGKASSKGFKRVQKKNHGVAPVIVTPVKVAACKISVPVKVPDPKLSHGQTESVVGLCRKQSEPTAGVSMDGNPPLREVFEKMSPAKVASSKISLETVARIDRQPNEPTEKVSLDENPLLPEASKQFALAGERTIPAPSFSRFCNNDSEYKCNSLTHTKASNLPELRICNLPEKRGTASSIVGEMCATDSNALPDNPLVPPAVSSESKAVKIGSSASSNSLSTESNGIGTLMTCHTMSPMESSRDTHEQCSAPTELESDISAIEINSYDGEISEMGDTIDIGELGSETLKQFQNAKLEESCIVVDGNELPFIPHKTGSPKSYKKKIRYAFASRMRSGKKQEYEQLAIWHRDVDIDIQESNPSAVSMGFKLPSHDESEWELL